MNYSITPMRYILDIRVIILTIGYVNHWVEGYPPLHFVHFPS